MTEGFFTKRLEGEAIEVSRWMMRFASTDESRPVLCGMCITTDGRMIAADGYTAAIAPVPSGYGDLVGKLVRPVGFDKHGRAKTKQIPATPATIDWESIDGTFPNVDEVFPKGKPTFRIGLNPTLLERIMHMPSDDNTIVIDLYHPTSPIKVSSSYMNEVYTALMMPKHLIDSELYDMGLEIVDDQPLEAKITRVMDERDATRRDCERLEDKVKQLETELAELRAVVIETVEDQGSEPEPEPEPDFDAVGAALLALGLLAGDEPEPEPVSVEATAYERHTFGHKSNGGGSNGGMKSLDIDALLG